MSKLLSACQRLRTSREAWRLALVDVSATARASDPSGPAPWLLAGLAALTANPPNTSLLIDLFHAWWAKHPARVAWLSASDAAQTLLKPMAQRHPFALVGTAALAGGLLVLLRPWRWLTAPSVWLSGLLPVLLAQVMRHQAPAPASSADNAP